MFRKFLLIVLGLSLLSFSSVTCGGGDSATGDDDDDTTNDDDDTTVIDYENDKTWRAKDSDNDGVPNGYEYDSGFDWEDKNDFPDDYQPPADDDDDNNDITTDDDDDNNDDNDTTENIPPVVNLPEEMDAIEYDYKCYDLGCNEEDLKKGCPEGDEMKEGLADAGYGIYDPDGTIEKIVLWPDYQSNPGESYELDYVCTEFAYGSSGVGENYLRIEVTDNDGAKSYGETIVHVESL